MIIAPWPNPSQPLCSNWQNRLFHVCDHTLDVTAENRLFSLKIQWALGAAQQSSSTALVHLLMFSLLK